MKKILFYSFVTMLIVSLSSCSKNDDEKNPVPEPAPKAPVLVSKITVTTDMPNKLANEVLEFSYDDNYRLKQAQWLRGEILKYTYGTSAIDLKVMKSNNPDYSGDYHFEIENGHPVRLEVTESNDNLKTDYSLEYSPDNYLQQITYVYDGRNTVEQLKWEDGNLVAFKDDGGEYPFYRPSTYLNDTNIDLSVITSGYINYVDLSYFSLIKQLGKSSKNIMESVPTTLYDYQYDYTVGTDGYMQNVVKKTTDRNAGKMYTTTYVIEYLNK